MFAANVVNYAGTLYVVGICACMTVRNKHEKLQYLYICIPIML